MPNLVTRIATVAESLHQPSKTKSGLGNADVNATCHNPRSAIFCLSPPSSSQHYIHMSHDLGAVQLLFLDF